MNFYKVEVIHKLKIEGASRRSKEKLKMARADWNGSGGEMNGKRFFFYPQVKPWGGHCNKIVVDVNALGI